MDFAPQAQHCRTPRQFRQLLRAAKTKIPCDAIFVTWGFPTESRLRYFINDGWPLEFVQWYLATGIMWRSPLYHEWLTTKKSFIWGEAYGRLKPNWKPEVTERFLTAGMEHALLGGDVNLEKDHFTLFVLRMENERKARDGLSAFESRLPSLIQAGQQVFYHNLLSPKETHILESRMLGKLLKQIAAEDRTSVRTVQAHLTNIKQKLGTNDLINAVVIAARQRLALHV